MNVSHELNCYSSTTDDSMSLKDRRMKVICKTEIRNKHVVSPYHFKDLNEILNIVVIVPLILI